MRKFYLTIGMLLCLIFSAQAQGTAVGLRGGVNFATIDGQDVKDNEFVWGYHIGVMLNTPLATGVSLQPEVLFSLKGTGDVPTDDNLTLMYVEVPVMAKVNLGNVLSLQFGPYVGGLINSKKGRDGVRDLLNTFDAGVGLGLGFAFSNRLGLDARYMYGLTDVYEDELPTTITGHPGGNRVLQLSLAYLFGGNR